MPELTEEEYLEFYGCTKATFQWPLDEIWRQVLAEAFIQPDMVESFYSDPRPR